MDNNIHSHTHVMDEKWIFLLIMNRDNSDKLCQHLIKTEKLSPPSGPPPLQSSISMASLQDNDKLGKSINGFSKGQRDVDTSVGCGAWSSRSRDIIQLCLYPRCIVHSFLLPWDVCWTIVLRTHGIGLTVAFSHGISPIKEIIVTRLCMVLFCIVNNLCDCVGETVRVWRGSVAGLLQVVSLHFAR